MLGGARRTGVPEKRGQSIATQAHSRSRRLCPSARDHLPARSRPGWRAEGRGRPRATGARARTSPPSFGLVTRLAKQPLIAAAIPSFQECSSLFSLGDSYVPVHLPGQPAALLPVYSPPLTLTCYFGTSLSIILYTCKHFSVHF